MEEKIQGYMCIFDEGERKGQSLGGKVEGQGDWKGMKERKQASLGEQGRRNLMNQEGGGGEEGRKVEVERGRQGRLLWGL